MLCTQALLIPPSDVAHSSGCGSLPRVTCTRGTQHDVGAATWGSSDRCSAPEQPRHQTRKQVPHKSSTRLAPSTHPHPSAWRRTYPTSAGQRWWAGTWAACLSVECGCGSALQQQQLHDTRLLRQCVCTCRWPSLRAHTPLLQGAAACLSPAHLSGPQQTGRHSTRLSKFGS